MVLLGNEQRQKRANLRGFDLKLQSTTSFQCRFIDPGLEPCSHGWRW